MPDIAKPIVNAAASAAVRIFKPLVRIMPRHGVPYKTLAEWLRWCYANVACEEFSIEGRKPSKSRVSVITGLTRVDVNHLLKQESPTQAAEHQEYHRAAKVLTG